MKKFLNNKVMDWKFKKAGEGHALNEEKSPTGNPTPSNPVSRSVPSQSSHTAGSAAIARFEGKDKRPYSSSSSGTRGVVKGGARAGGGSGGRKVCAQMPQQEALPKPVVVDVSSSNVIVHLICPMCQRSVPSYEMPTHLASCLQEEFSKEPLTSSVQMIHTLCQDQDQRKLCIDTITKYLDNILAHPGEDKYCKIRLQNKAFQDRVAGIPGAMLFLEAIGFNQQLLPHQDTEEQFLVLCKESADNLELLSVHRELLLSAQPLNCKVDRNLQVFRPSSRMTEFNLPDDFFHLTVDEMKREQKQRSELLEKASVLRTKAMRERDETRMAVRHYRFVLVRIRMPDGFVLQGIFRPLEKLRDVRAFVSEVLVDQTHTFSFSVLGNSYTEEDQTLAVLGLVPSAILNFVWNCSAGPPPPPPHLIPELLARVQDFQ